MFPSKPAPDGGSVGPASYAEWRASALGAATDAIESDLILRLAGEVGGRRVLDAGCGDGWFLAVLRERGAAAVGLDLDPRMLAAARSRPGSGAALVRGRVESLPFRDGAFDVVFATTVLCFVHSAERVVREMARVLAPSGSLVLGELGRWSWWAAWRRLRGWLGSETWRAARFRGPRELRALVEGAGLEVDELRGGIYYPPLAAAARLLAGSDACLSRMTPFGAAFLALRAHRVESSS